MTLIELVVSIVLIGLLATVIAAAITVTFRQERDTSGRLSVARWEQSLGIWLPTDLASSETVDTDAGTAPCGTAACTFGSNAIQLAWNDGSGATTVSYRYGPSGDGTSFELRRVVCSGGSCRSLTILRDLAAPSGAWAAGVDGPPAEVIQVAAPLEVLETSPDGTTVVTPRSQRVIVNVNGAPDIDGTDRSSTVSFTAGGATLGPLTPANLDRPSFVDARSGCGGPISLVVDESGSIGGAASDVRAGVRSFVQELSGTPVRLQIIRMYGHAETLGAGGAWNKWFDLSDPADVALLIGPPPGTSGGFVASLESKGSGEIAQTNWEDALFRVYFTQDGTPYTSLGDADRPPSETLVFFTDGVPTRHRASTGSGTYKTDTSSIGPTSIPSVYDTDDNAAPGGVNPRGWYRSRDLLNTFSGLDITRTIGVGVGSAFGGNSQFGLAGWPANVPNRVMLGELVAPGSGGNPHQYAGVEDFVVAEYSGGWPANTSTADLLTTTDFSQFGSALRQIALDECGGTLTVQTRDASGPADADVTYEIAGSVVTTTRVATTGTFDIDFAGSASANVDLVPQSLAGSGFVPSSWSCKSGGVDLGGDYSQLTGDPQDGINITVDANEAVACTLMVVPG